VIERGYLRRLWTSNKPRCDVKRSCCVRYRTRLCSLIRSPSTTPTENIMARDKNASSSGEASMSEVGQSRRFRAAPEESGPPPITDIRCQRLTFIGLDLTVRRYSVLRSTLVAGCVSCPCEKPSPMFSAPVAAFRCLWMRTFSGRTVLGHWPSSRKESRVKCEEPV
jgi:hypothetical protein